MTCCAPAGRSAPSPPELGRSPSTISREIRRNSSEAGNYRPFTAHRRALARRPRPRPGKLAHDKPLRDFVQAKLTLRWSPEQISHALPIEFPGQRERHLVHETIYQALYVQGRGELRRELTRALRTGRARRKPHRRPDARRQGCIVDPTVMISQRPAEAEDRAIPGHWEGDLIIGRGQPLGDRHPGRTHQPGTSCCCTCRPSTPPKRSAMR